MTDAAQPEPHGATAVPSRQDLVAASGDELYVRCSAPDGDLLAWRLAQGVAWTSLSPHRRRAGWLTVVAEPQLVPALVRTAATDTGGAITGVTVPADSLALLPAGLRPPEYNLWDWFWTSTSPPVQPGEHAVSWATPADESGIVQLLDGHSPRHSARPGEASVRRWCVIHRRGADVGEADGHPHGYGADGVRADDVVACAAHVEYVTGVPHLASIVTRTDLRGRGLAGAVTAWLTRRLIEEGESIVTLGMYGDNEVARRLYRRLGYVDSHHWASGRLPGGQPAATSG